MRKIKKEKYIQERELEKETFLGERELERAYLGVRKVESKREKLILT